MPMDTKQKGMQVPISVSLPSTNIATRLKNVGSMLHIPVLTHILYLTLGMIHDCAISENWIIFILLPMTVNLNRLKEGGKHFMWDDDLPMVLIVLPRNNPKPSDARSYPYKTQSFIGHIGNAWDVDKDHVNLDTPLENGNVFGAFFPNEKGEAPKPGTVSSRFVRFHIDTRKPSGTFIGEPELLVNVNGGMPRVDDRFIGYKTRYHILSVVAPPKRKRIGLNEGGVAGRGFANSIGLVDAEKRSYVTWWAGEMAAVGEPVFVPRTPDSREGDGYVICMVARIVEQIAELVILDLNSFHNTQDDGYDIEPVARIVLPFRLRSGIHGSWVPASEMGEWKQLCDMHGVDEKTMQTFAEPVYHGTANGEVLKGHERWDRDNHGGDEDGHAPGAEVVVPDSKEWTKTALHRIKLGAGGWGKDEVDAVNGVNGHSETKEENGW